jgi:hypothetical protein
MSDSFFNRWSRQKSLQRDLQAPAPAAPAQPQALPVPTPAAPGPDAATAVPDTPAPTVDDAQALDVGADVRRYLQADVSEAARHLALKKLFADPQYNVISDMDDYVEDFSQLATLTAQEVSQLEQFKSLNPLKDPFPAAPEAKPADDTAASAPNETPEPHSASATSTETPAPEAAQPLPGDATADGHLPRALTASESPDAHPDPQPPVAS